MSQSDQQTSETTRHSITLQQLATLIAAELREVADPQSTSARKGALKAICQYVSQACLDDAFVGKHLPDRAPGEPDREILYEDSELGFCICGHVYAKAAIGNPHDHGPSWAIYGQAAGETEMSDWKIDGTAPESKNDAPQDAMKLVSKTDTYTLHRGDVHVYDIGDVHSPLREHPVKLIRIEGENLDLIKRSSIKVAGA